MLNKIQLAIIAVIAIAIMESCSSTEDVVYSQPYLFNLHNTECLNALPDLTDASRASESGTSFIIDINGTTAKCQFLSLEYPCDFEKVNVKASFSDNVLTIVEYPSSDKADCICEVNASFIIKELPSTNFTLRIFRGDTSGNCHADRPEYEDSVNIQSGPYEARIPQ